MKSFDEYLRDAEQAHGHLCAGQILGVRLAMLGLQKLQIDAQKGAAPNGAARIKPLTLLGTPLSSD